MFYTNPLDTRNINICATNIFHKRNSAEGWRGRQGREKEQGFKKEL